MIGITSYGGYIPRLRLNQGVLCSAKDWMTSALIDTANGERSMANWDEDIITMAVEASRDCINGSDKNLLRIDPEFVKLGGGDTPILHGLCSYGLAGRAILNGTCGYDTASLKSFGVWFINVVIPGETLTTKGWKIAETEYIVQTEGGDGRVALAME